jgi:hypothetical protein
MSNLVCIQSNHMLIIFCIFIGLAVLYNMYGKMNHNNMNYDYEDKIITRVVKTINASNNATKAINANNNVINNEYIARRQYLDNRDRSVLYDDFAPPEKRVPEYMYPFNYIKNRLNIPTRGYPENYQIMGVLLREDTETAYNLFGRQTYPGSNLWEYYCENDKYNNVKLPVKIHGNKEIMDGDMVHVPGTNSSNGKFKVKLYKYDEPRYVPII